MAQTEESKTDKNLCDTSDQKEVLLKTASSHSSHVKKSPYTCDQIKNSLNHLSVGPKVRDNKTDFHYKLYFKNKPLYIETPLLWVPFNINTYRNPGSKRDKTSIHLGLQTYTPELKEFKDTILKIDEVIKGIVHLPPDTYWSAVRHNIKNPTLPPVLRVKIHGRKDSLNIDLLYEENTWKSPSASTIESFITDNTAARCILEVCSVWSAGGKWGVSYRCHVIQIVKRTIEMPLFK